MPGTNPRVDEPCFSDDVWRFVAVDLLKRGSAAMSGFVVKLKHGGLSALNCKYGDHVSVVSVRKKQPRCFSHWASITKRSSEEVQSQKKEIARTKGEINQVRPTFEAQMKDAC
jgi:hypothetical protein